MRRAWFQPEFLLLLALGLATQWVLHASEAPQVDEPHARLEAAKNTAADEASSPKTDDDDGDGADEVDAEPAPIEGDAADEVEAPSAEPDAADEVDAPPVEPAPPRVEVLSRRPLLVDVDDDLVPEVIVITSFSGEPWLVAVSLVEERFVWSYHLNGADKAAVTFVPAWDLFLVHDRWGLHAIARESAWRWWTAWIWSRMVRVGVQHGQVRVVDPLGEVATIGRDGSVRDSSRAVLDAAHELPIDMPPPSWLGLAPYVGLHWQPPSADVAELGVRQVFCGDRRDPPMPAEGRARCPSTRSVGLALVDGTPKLLGFRSARGGKLDWTLDIEPSRTYAGLDAFVVDVRHRGDDGYMAFYEEGRDEVTLARFSVKTGEIRWISLQETETGGGLDLSGDDRRLLVHTGGNLLVIDTATGHQRLCFGACRAPAQRLD